MNIIKRTVIIANALAPACALFLFCAAPAQLTAQTPPPSPAAALAAPIATLTGKTDLPAAAGARPKDYVSYARCYWPDPAKPDGLPFIPRDGEPNTTQIARGDLALLSAFFNTVESLANAWLATRDATAARRAGEWLRAWLVAPATRMNPNLDYAGIRSGSDNNRGSAAGVADGGGFGKIIAAIKNLDDSPALTAADKEALRQWFTMYLDWLMTSKNGMAARASQDSDGTWFVAQALPIADYVGRDYLARALIEEAQKRIAVQIQRDGSQPREMQRADSLSYSAFNLAAYAQIAQAAAPLGVDLWNYVSSGRSSLGAAVDFLAPYNTDPAKWPHPQKERLQPGFLDEIIKARNTPLKIGAAKTLAPTPPAVPTAPAPSAPAASAPGAPPQIIPATPMPPQIVPAAPGAPAVSSAAASVNIVIQKDGGILLNGKKVSTKQLSDMLSMLKTVTGDVPVLVSMEPSAPSQTMAAVMDACRKEGFSKISMQMQ